MKVVQLPSWESKENIAFSLSSGSRSNPIYRVSGFGNKNQITYGIHTRGNMKTF